MRSADDTKSMSCTKAPVRKFTPRGRSHATSGSMNAWVLIDTRAHHARHVRQVPEQVEETVHVASKLDRAVLGQRPHDRRPEQPEFGREKSRRKEFLDALPIQHGFGH